MGRNRADRLVVGILMVLSCLLLGSVTAYADGASAAPGPQAAGKAATKQVNINTATEEELQSVPGIGKVLSRRIVEFRDEHGPFRRVEDIMKVRGIGEKSFVKIRPYLSVGESE